MSPILAVPCALIGGLATQLHERYPDDAYQRMLRGERDREAQERRADAMNKLVEILVEAVVKEAAEGRRLTTSGRTAKSWR